jgi:hypothetical protein
MVGIKIQGEFIDLFPGTDLPLELFNPAFLGDNADLIPGSFSYPISVPATRKNRRIFEHPDLVTNPLPFLRAEPTELHYDGLFLFPGKLTVQTATPTQYRLYIVFSELTSLKDKTLQEIDLGGDRNVAASPNDMPAHAEATTQNPLNFDYCFFPIRNFDFWDGREEDPLTGESKVQNAWDVDTQAFIASSDQLTAMPFVRLSYLLQQLIAEFGLVLDNQFQNSDELNLIYLYNNFSICLDTGDWSNVINLQNHVNNTTCNEFLRHLCRQFCLAPFKEWYSNEVSLVPLKGLINTPAKHDWTNKASANYSRSKDNKYPGKFCYESLDEAFTQFLYTDPPVADDEYATLDDVPGPPYTPFQVYYITAYGSYWATSGNGTRIVEVWRGIECMETGTGEEEFLGQLPTTIMNWAGTSGQGNIRGLVPELRQKGSWDQAEEPFYEEFQNRLIFFRGNYLDRNGKNYPMASNNVYDNEGNQIGDYSLLWKGDHGLYEKWWKEWHYILENRSEVEFQFRLEVADLYRFSFKDKVRIGGMEYFVKKLSVVLTATGQVKATGVLISIT